MRGQAGETAAPGSFTCPGGGRGTLSLLTRPVGRPCSRAAAPAGRAQWGHGQWAGVAEANIIAPIAAAKCCRRRARWQVKHQAGPGRSWVEQRWMELPACWASGLPGQRSNGI